MKLQELNWGNKTPFLSNNEFPPCLTIYKNGINYPAFYQSPGCLPATHNQDAAAHVNTLIGLICVVFMGLQT